MEGSSPAPDCGSWYDCARAALPNDPSDMHAIGRPVKRLGSSPFRGPFRRSKGRVPVLTLLTPVAERAPQWLGELADDVAELRRRVGREHRIEWIVCADGASFVTAPGASATHVGWAGGAAVARTRALSVAQGEWVLPMDADDRIDIDGVTAVLAILLGVSSDVGWAGAARVLVDGWTIEQSHVPERQWAIGDLAAHWRSPFAFHPNSIFVRREIALQVGGWPALPVNEDLGFALLVGEAAAGITLPTTVTRYRAWPGQTVAQPDYPSAKAVAFETIAALVNATRRVNGRGAVAAPPPA